eukprot:35949-Prymnesium_polylepis.1
MHQHLVRLAHGRPEALASLASFRRQRERVAERARRTASALLTSRGCRRPRGGNACRRAPRSSSNLCALDFAVSAVSCASTARSRRRRLRLCSRHPRVALRLPLPL